MRKYSINKDHQTIIFSVLIAIIIFIGMDSLERYLYQNYSSQYFLTFHNILEFASVLGAFSIFTITFYTFEKSHRLRTIIIACVFLAVGILDSFHTLSYKGMPVFFTVNDANKATTFWIAARMVSAIGLFVISFLSREKTIKSSRFIFLGATIGLCIYLLAAVSYHWSFLPPMYVEGKGLTRLKIHLEYMVILLYGTAAVLYLRRLFKNNQREYSWMVIGLVLCIFSEMAFTLYKSVYDSYNGLGHIYKVVAYYIFFRAFFIANIQKPYLELADARQEIRHYADHLEELVDIRTEEISHMNEKLLMDIEYARNIQMALLPTDFPHINELKFSSRYIPCQRIGGDFYNVVRLDDEHIGVYIGDVAGHGVTAAMVAVFLNQYIKMKRVYNDENYKILPPREALLNLYHVYNKTEFPEEIYLVMIYGIYHIPSREFTYSSAGMNAPPIYCKADGRVEIVNTKGFPICKFGDHYKPMYENHTIKLAPGEKLIFYSDGLTEILNDDPEMFTTQELVNKVEELLPARGDALCDGIIREFYRLLDNHEMIDDVTLLIMET